MITEDYVSFEVAKLLKEKGFDEDCYTFYEYDSKELYREERIPCCNSRSDDYAAPTLQMAMKWLREVHNIFIEVYKAKVGYICWIVDIPSNDGIKDLENDENNYTTYEDAIEVALKYVLKKLI